MQLSEARQYADPPLLVRVIFNDVLNTLSCM